MNNFYLEVRSHQLIQDSYLLLQKATPSQAAAGNYPFRPCPRRFPGRVQPGYARRQLNPTRASPLIG